MASVSGMVFDIQSFSVHDGPGIRTTVFLKGCPLSCGWCHNPEGLSPHRQIMLNTEKCIGCRACETVCKQGVHGFDGNRHIFLPQKCNACGECVAVCPARALSIAGMRVTVDEVFERIMRDKPFYGECGGVTFSGGEVFCQTPFLIALLKEAKKKELHTVIDTSGYTQWRNMEEAIPYTDLFLYDVKAFSPALHQKLTGVDNTVIKQNLKKLDKNNIPVWIRMPLIHGVNDAPDELGKTAQFLTELSCIKKIELMPYHVLGRSKYMMLGIREQQEYHAPPEAQLQEYKQLFKSYGLHQIV